ncbi:MAG: murein biosynthesis integral membrane protein MurJ [Acidobacteriota bacterium]|nr:murein biosynthesis integral membrane protein MurJ [Acidobacteriota bacterium]
MNSAPVTRRIAQASGIVMATVLASRVLGFFRDWTLAHQIGANAITDTYVTAFTLPDFLNYLVAGASLSLTFIPVFTKFVAEKREDEGWHVFSTVVTVMGALVVAVVVAGEIFTPYLAKAIAPGFGPTEKTRYIFLTRLMLPAQICFYLGSILSAVQYAKGQFLIPSLAPVIYNVGVILGGILLAPRIGITGFAVGVLGGAVAGNLLLQVYGAWRAGARFSPNVDVRHPGFWMFIKLTVPIMLALSLVFTDDWILRWFGSYLVPASITWLYNAKNLMRVPLGVVGQAVGVASFPFLSRLYSEGKLEELNRTLNSTMRALILLLMPISALTIAQSVPLVYLVYSHTSLRATDLQATAATLAVFSLGMFAWGAQNILARGFYVARDTITPAIVGTLLTVLNLPVYWLLVRHYQHLGLALASSIGIIAYTLLLFGLLNRRTNNQEAAGMVWFFLKITTASAIAAGVCFKLTQALQTRIGWHTTLHALVVLVIVSSVGFVMIAVLAKLFRVREMDSYLAKLRL